MVYGTLNLTFGILLFLEGKLMGRTFFDYMDSGVGPLSMIDEFFSERVIEASWERVSGILHSNMRCQVN